MTLSATPFSIYLTSAPDRVRYVIDDAGAKVAIVEEPFVPLVKGVVERAGRGSVGGGPGLRRRAPLARGAARRHPHLIYTSGTTGPPKGVQIAHRNQMAAVDAVEQRVGFSDGSRVISWLPSAHVAERTAHHHLPIVYAMKAGQPIPEPLVQVDHQRRRQEHVAGERRGDVEGLLAADRPGLRDRRRPPLRHGADRARRRLRARLGGSAGS